MARTSVATDAFTGALNGAWGLITTASAAIDTDGIGHMIGAHSPEAIARWTANSFSNDQYSKLTVVFWPGTGGADAVVGVMVRCSADENAARDYYQYFASEDGVFSQGTQTRTFTLQKVVNGTVTVIASGGVSCGVNSTIAIEVEGDNLRGYVDDVLTHSGTGGSSLSTGRPAISNSRSGAILADDWDGGDVTAAAASMTPPVGAAALAGVASSRVVGTLLTPVTP